MNSKHREAASDRLRELIAEATGSFPSSDYTEPVVAAIMDAVIEEMTERIMVSEKRSETRLGLVRRKDRTASAGTAPLTGELGDGFSNG